MLRLSLNTGFLVNRYPSPKQWAQVIASLGAKHIQLTADLFSPNYPDSVLDEYVDQIQHQISIHNFQIYSVFTGAFTRVNHFCHPDKSVRDYWLTWFDRFARYASLLGAKRLGSHIGILSIPDNLHSRTEFQLECFRYWKKLASIASQYGITELTWEHMSISREQGHKCNDINFIIDQLSDSAIPIRLCLDPDHGDLTSSNPLDYDPYHLLKTYLPHSSQLHLKQTSPDKRKNGPFTGSLQKNGLINADRVLQYLCEAGLDQTSDFELILELNAREREPDDSSIVKAVSQSLDYWRSALDRSQLVYS